MSVVGVLADSYLGLVAAIAIKNKNPGSSVSVFGRISANHRVVQLQINLQKFSQLMGIDLFALLVLGDATVNHGQLIKRQGAKTFFLANDIYGQSDEVADFHQLFLSNPESAFKFDDFSLLANLARSQKVLNPLDRSSVGIGAGLNINELALIKILRQKMIELEISIEENPIAELMISEKGCFSGGGKGGGENFSPDLIVDARSGDLDRSGEFVDWSGYFPLKPKASTFEFNERLTAPQSEIESSPELIIKKTSLRTGVQYDFWCLNNREGNLDPFFGRQKESWRGKYVSLGKRACWAGEIFVSELDMMLESIDLLVLLWPSGKACAEAVSEFNRRVNITYDSLVSFHILVMMCWKGEMAINSQKNPEALREDLELFDVCGRLAKIDGRFPGVHLWIAALMFYFGKKSAIPLMGCDRNSIEINEYFSAQKHSLNQTVDSAVLHVDFINNILSDFGGKKPRAKA